MWGPGCPESYHQAHSQLPPQQEHHSNLKWGCPLQVDNRIEARRPKPCWHFLPPRRGVCKRTVILLTCRNAFFFPRLTPILTQPQWGCQLPRLWWLSHTAVIWEQDEVLAAGFPRLTWQWMNYGSCKHIFMSWRCNCICSQSSQGQSCLNKAPAQTTASCRRAIGSLTDVRAFRPSKVFFPSPEQISRLPSFYLPSFLSLLKSTRTLSHWQKEVLLWCIAISCNKLHWLFPLFFSPFAIWTIDFEMKLAITTHSASQQGPKYLRERVGEGRTLWRNIISLLFYRPELLFRQFSAGYTKGTQAGTSAKRMVKSLIVACHKCD